MRHLGNKNFQNKILLHISGGHRDRKHEGYHVHNYSKYCACHPDAPECKDDTNKKEEKKSTDTKQKNKK